MSDSLEDIRSCTKWLVRGRSIYNSTNDVEIAGLTSYPNPTKNSWTVKTKNIKMASIEVFDMLGKNVITIWGVTHPFAGFVPFHQPMENQLVADRERYPKIPTSIYGNTFPEGYEHAAGSISPDTIIDKIKTFL